jgi:predicted DNA binding CopG/RHH family protein
MKRKTRYSNESLGKLEIVPDFLPAPDQLVMKEDGVKVTLSLSKRSVEFFKRYAQKSNVPYQKMIRSLLDSYAIHHEGHKTAKRDSGRKSA